VTRVLLVDDQALVRAGFRALLDAEPDIEVVGEAADGAEAVRLAASLLPDVVLMDIRMPGMDGLAATAQIGRDDRLAGVRIVVLTTFDLDEYVVAAIGAGASGFLLKDAPPEEMLAAVRTVHAGDSVIAASSTRRLLQHVAPMLRGAGAGTTQADPGTLAELTPREREVLVQMAYGTSNTEIASRLFVSEATVKTHVGRVLAKTGSRDRVQAVVLAYRTGLVAPADLLRDAPAC
jgi:DNA-binding NarL/FixJ family response regulator